MDIGWNTICLMFDIYDFQLKWSKRWKEKIKEKNYHRGKHFKEKINTFFLKKKDWVRKEEKDLELCLHLSSPRRKELSNSPIVSVLLTWNLQFICSPLLSTKPIMLSGALPCLHFINTTWWWTGNTSSFKSYARVEVVFIRAATADCRGKPGAVFYYLKVPIFTIRLLVDTPFVKKGRLWFIYGKI